VKLFSVDSTAGDLPSGNVSGTRLISTRIALALLILIFAGCSNPKKAVFAPGNHDKVLEQSQKLADDDRKELIAALARNAFAQYPLDGKTVGEVLDEQRKFEADQAAADRVQKAAQEKEAKRIAEAQRVMRESISVQVLSTHYQDSDFANGVYESGMVLAVQYHNTGRKKIKAFKGTLEFDNQFGDKIDETTIDGEDPIAVGDTQRHDLISSYGLSKIRTRELSQMKVRWKPASILFADGSTI